MTRAEAVDRAREWFDSPGVTRAIKVVALISLAVALFVGLKQNQLTGCLATWNDANNRISAARAAANDGDRKALDDMIEQIATARSMPTAAADATVDRAFVTYLKARAFADGQRAANQIPPPPSSTC